MSRLQLAEHSFLLTANLSELCIIFALPQERGKFVANGKTGGPQVLVTGAGETAAYTRTSSLLRSGHFASLLICGYCGALSDVPVGSVVLPNTVVAGYDGVVYQSLTPDNGMLSALDKTLNQEIIRGAVLVSGSRVLLNREEKLAAARKYSLEHPAVVDMESAACARAAMELNVPWAVLRVVTDSVDDEMPLDFNALNDRNGQPHLLKIVLACLMKPSSISGLIQLGRRSSAATTSLHKALNEIRSACGRP